MTDKEEHMDNQTERRKVKNKNGRQWVRRLHMSMSMAIIAVIGILVIGNVIKGDATTSEKENRTLASKPDFTLNNVANGSYMTDYETYQSDQFVFRDLWMSLKTGLDSLTGKNCSNGIYKGKDGYLIADATVPNEQYLQKNIQAINTLADSGTATVYTMIVPNAVSIISDKLPANAPVHSQDGDLTTFRASLSANVHDIDVKASLLAHNQEEIYYHTDHHWTTTGAYYGFLDLAQVLGIDTTTINYQTYKIASDFSGTMASTSGYSGKKDTIEVYVPKENTPEYVLEYVEEQEKKASVYNTEMLETKDKYAVFLGGNSPIIRINTTAETERKIMIIKDSYANCLIPFLTPYFKEIVVVDPRYYYGNIYEELSSQGITEVLFLYNGNTFFEDNSISGIFAME